MGGSEFELSLNREESKLQGVVSLLGEIELQARDFYASLSESAAEDPLSSLWRSAEEEGKRYAAFWSELAPFLERSRIANAYPDVDASLKELGDAKAKLKALLSNKEALAKDRNARLLCAIRLEFYKMNKALPQLLRLTGNLARHGCPYDGYESRLRGFSAACAGLGEELKEETKILAEVLPCLWKDGMKLAARMDVDELTGLLNRRGFSSAAIPLVNFVQKRREKAAFLIADIDRFKTINDLFGHGKGDEVLRTIAKAMRSALRASDVMGRYGGEEFIVLCAPLKHESGLAIAERLRSVVEACYFERCPVTVSVGAVEAELPAEGMLASEILALLCAQADRLLLQAKQNGRNRVVFQERRLDAARA